MFEGDSADMCAGKFPLVSMGGWAEGLACADPGARTPIGASGNFPINYLCSISCFVWIWSKLLDKYLTSNFTLFYSLIQNMRLLLKRKKYNIQKKYLLLIFDVVAHSWLFVMQNFARFFSQIMKYHLLSFIMFKIYQFCEYLYVIC